MRQLRSTLRKGTTGRALKDRELCSGPSKLCQALAIDKSFDQRDLAKDRAVWLERSPPGPSEPAVVAAARVGIGHAGEWAQKPLRFYLRGQPLGQRGRQSRGAERTGLSDSLLQPGFLIF